MEHPFLREFVFLRASALPHERLFLDGTGPQWRRAGSGGNKSGRVADPKRCSCHAEPMPLTSIRFS